MTIVEHLEKFLGPIIRGWSSAKGLGGVQVCLFENAPREGLLTLSTLGLSRHELVMREGRTVRQELLLVVDRQDHLDRLANLLFFLAERALDKHQAILAHEVVAIEGAIVRGSRIGEVYATTPNVFDEGIDEFAETVPSTICVWLVPVHHEEVHYRQSKGASAFESLLEEKNPDLFDLMRESVV